MTADREKKRRYMSILGVVILIGIVAVSIYIQNRNSTYSHTFIDYGFYEFDTLQDYSDVVICGRVLSIEDQHITEFSAGTFTYVTDYVVEILDESGKAQGTLILREPTHYTKNQNMPKVNKMYVFCLNQFKEPLTEGVSYKIRGKKTTYNEYYMTVAGPATFFEANEIHHGCATTISPSDCTFSSMTGAYPDKTLSDFCLTAWPPDNHIGEN